jgi:hypothetical protein
MKQKDGFLTFAVSKEFEKLNNHLDSNNKINEVNELLKFDVIHSKGMHLLFYYIDKSMGSIKTETVISFLRQIANKLNLTLVPQFT